MGRDVAVREAFERDVPTAIVAPAPDWADPTRLDLHPFFVAPAALANRRPRPAPLRFATAGAAPRRRRRHLLIPSRGRHVARVRWTAVDDSRVVLSQATRDWLVTLR